MKAYNKKNKKQTSSKLTTTIETQEIFLKRIKDLDVKEQESLLKLYNEIVKEITA